MGTWDVVVVGSGVCGLTIAHNLQEHGRSVLLLDKGSRPGGRLASRPLAGALLNPAADTVVTHDAHVMREIARRTEAEFAAEPDHGARWRFAASAGDVARTWAAGTTLQRTFVTQIEVADSGLLRVVPHASGDPVICQAVVLTPPVPQSVQILRTSHLRVSAALAEVGYDKRAVLLCVLRGDVGGELASHESTLVDAIRVRRRDDSGLVWLEVFATPHWSESTWNLDANFVHSALLVEMKRLFPGAHAVDSELKRWRYANAVAALPGAGFDQSQDHPGIFVAGDGFGSVDGHPAGVSRAVRSGLDVVRALS
ncbi:FAD-dependent oxidoreductase [Cryobacterium sp. TMT1-21]|uniref:FAD-dependent oxidoreductase n=1 Tax=Cryobacterium shii TaxID=1259235 RepID=A0AAQ2C8I6_9MICO|nr:MULTISPECIES: FAD-dependent oxidoreductase [Cryobacterium]TFC52221.1 FAD-dependent oxidoreductase [Cryobacterium shii]TFD15653.1 FAD-dependent oxidoreductase [Cryobacterium sp. TMT1-21]TFD18952.1 FAD-dependent oxidoreductase [Cryobacterium sp. TMT2-23]TFD39431.1 FAD-dependent oxidoreductase [Cryobacterium sp. TMT2-10]